MEVSNISKQQADAIENEMEKLICSYGKYSNEENASSYCNNKEQPSTPGNILNWYIYLLKMINIVKKQNNY